MHWRGKETKVCQTNLTRLLTWLSALTAVLQEGQTWAAWLTPAESTCDSCASWHSLPAVSLGLQIPSPWFTTGAVKDGLRLHRRKNYKGSGVQRHLIKHPFKPHVDLQEGSKWPSGGFCLPISTGQHGVRAETLGCNWLCNPTTSFKHRQTAVHLSLGCSKDGWGTAVGQ